MNKKKLEAEAAFAAKAYKNRSELNRKAREVLTGSRPITIRLNNQEIAIAKPRAETKGLRYQTYIKMLLHEALSKA